MAGELDGITVAILASDMVEEAELTEPRQAMERAGASTILIAPAKREIISANHFEQSNSYPVDITFDKDDVREEDFDAVFLPGGALNADFLRTNAQAQKFVQDIDKSGKPLAVICHAPWLLVSAGLVKGRHLTSFSTIADDIRNAGGRWSDEAVVRDDNWVSSRQPDDIPEFNKAVVGLFTTGARTRKLQPVL